MDRGWIRPFLVSPLSASSVPVSDQAIHAESFLAHLHDQESRQELGQVLAALCAAFDRADRFLRGQVVIRLHLRRARPKIRSVSLTARRTRAFSTSPLVPCLMTVNR